MATMIFEKTDYLSWYLPRMHRQEATLPMHASGMPAVDARTLEADLGNPWDVTRRFEEALATWQDVDASMVVATPGGTGGTLLALLSWVDPGQTVCVEAPHYEPMVRQAQRLGPVARFQRRPEECWALPMDTLRRQLSDGAKLVLMTEPCNPAGLFAPQEQVMELAELARKSGATLLINEVYREFSLRPTWFGRHPSIAVVSSLSKLCGLYWARTGWILARPELAQQLRKGLLNFGMGSQTGCAWGLPVVRDIGQYVSRAREATSQGVDIVDRWVSAQPGIGWCRPEGTGFGALVLPTGTDDLALAERLLDQYGVLAIPGTLFEAPGTLRVSWMGLSADVLDEGLNRLGRLLKTLNSTPSGEPT